MINNPKRKKDKYNPYTLDFVDCKYIVTFIDNKKNKNNVEVSQEVFNLFNKFELDDLSQMHKYERHIEHLDIYDNILNSKYTINQKSLEEEVEEKLLRDDLKNAFKNLSNVQKRRIKMYYFDEMKLKDIAEIEHCSIMSVKESIDSGIDKLRKSLKN